MKIELSAFDAKDMEVVYTFVGSSIRPPSTEDIEDIGEKMMEWLSSVGSSNEYFAAVPRVSSHRGRPSSFFEREMEFTSARDLFSTMKGVYEDRDGEVYFFVKIGGDEELATEEDIDYVLNELISVYYNEGRIFPTMVSHHLVRLITMEKYEIKV